MTIEVVDSQVHTWDSVLNDSIPPHREKPLTLEDLTSQMAEAGVSRVLLTPPSWSIGMAAALASLTDLERFRIVARVPLEPGYMPTQGEVRSWCASPALAGLRLVLWDDRSVDAYRAGAADWIWAIAQEHRLPMMIYTPGRQDLLREIVTEHPEVQFAADHLSLPISVDGLSALEMRGEISALIDLAHLPNLAVKASALPLYSKESFPFRDLHGPLYDVIAAFGAERVFWGTDLSRLTCSYEEAVRMVRDEMPGLSDEDRTQVMGSALMRWLPWRDTAAIPSQS